MPRLKYPVFCFLLRNLVNKYQNDIQIHFAHLHNQFAAPVTENKAFD